MKNLLTFILFFSAALAIQAQEKYRVTYDYATEEVGYYHLNKYNKVDDTLAKPRFKKNSLIELKLTNVNPFAVDIVTDVKEEEIHESSGGFSFGSLLGGINSFSGGNLQMNVDNLPDQSLFSEGFTSRGKGLSNKFSELNTLSANVDAMKSSLLSNLLNPNMDKETIMSNMKEAANQISDARLADPNSNFYMFLASLDKVVKEDSQDIASDINALTKDLDNQAITKTEMSRGELHAQNTAYTDLKNLLISITQSSLQTSENINRIKELYTTLEASSFEQTYDYLIEADKVNIELKFVQSQFANENDLDNEQNTLKERNLRLFSKGGFKINTSIAMTLNNFGDNSKDFYISEDGYIGEDVNDNFVPNLSTMINFYPVLGENFNVGGSFGLSIPITNDLKGLNFLLGPSFFIGSKNRLAFSGGVAYGPVSKLTNGLEVGQQTEVFDIDNYTKSVYDFGYYFGISFSLFDIK